jgi:hypothetical protein
VPWKALGDPNTAVVTGFPNTTVAAAHRQRIVAVSGKSRWLTLPPGTDTRSLEGHPSVFTWEEVLAKAPKPVHQPRGKRVAPTTVYHGHKAGQRVQVKGDEPILLYCGPKWSHHRSTQYPEAVWVPLPRGSIAKFKRLNPQAQDGEAYKAHRLQVVRDALTETDKMTGNPSVLAMKLAKVVGQIKDPLLREAVAAVGRQESDTLKAAKAAGVSIPEPKVNKEIGRRYQLLVAAFHWSAPKVSLTEVVEYANMKFDALSAETETKEEGAA